MFRKHDRDQLKMQDNKQRFVVDIDPENRWVRLSRIMPWDQIEDHYAENMCDDNGRGAITSRIAFGAIYAKESLNLTDRGIVEHINENVYLQYFLGLPEYENAPLFDSSMMVHFRRRFAPGFILDVNEYICTGKWPEHKDGGDNQDTPDLPVESDAKHEGRLTLDATVAPSDIRHPNDVLLLDECRENLEAMIDELWEPAKEAEEAKQAGATNDESAGAGEQSDQEGRAVLKSHKTPYHRWNAHRKAINFIKRKKKSGAFIRSALSTQLNYVELAVRQVLALLMLCGLDSFTDCQWDRFDTICRIYLQQKWMYDNNTSRCEGKIMNLRQPHVRAVLRNKARTKYEFGQKLALSKAGGWVFVERQSWDNFNECNTLQQSVKNYYDRFGCYPEVILADQIYHTRGNKKFCRGLGIRLSGMGRYGKNASQSEKRAAYKDQCERNEIEGVNGVLKRRYGLDLIMCRLKHNAEVEAFLQILAMNLHRRLRIILSFFRNIHIIVIINPEFDR